MKGSDVRYVSSFGIASTSSSLAVTCMDSRVQ